MSFRVCLVDPPLPQLINRDMYSSTISKGGYKWPAADLLVLSGILKELTSEVSLLDANAEGLDIEQTLSRIDRFSPTHLIFMLGASAFQEDFSFVKAAKDRFPGLITIGTGGLLYHDGPYCLKNHPSVDAIVNNFTTRDVIRYLVGDLDQLRNFTYRDQDGEIIETASDFHRDDYSHPLPCHEQLPLTGYKLSHVKYLPLTSVLTSYGCPARCSYCVTERINYRPRQVENVLEELRYVKSLGIRTVFFRDPTFLAAKKTGMELLERMIQERLELSWVADTRAVCVTKETAPLIAESGGHCLHFGVESASPETLERYSKGVTTDQVRNAFSLCQKHNIRTVGYFILGLPGETERTVRQTIDFAIELDADYASFNMPIPVKGTSLRDEVIRNGWMEGGEHGEYDGSFQSKIHTPELDPQKITALLQEARKKFYLRPRYIFKRLAKVQSPTELKTLWSEFLVLLWGLVRAHRKGRVSAQET